jgi:hypothetical protein
MMRGTLLIVTSVLLLCGSTAPAVAPVPESQQAALALNILQAYRGADATNAALKLQLVYFTPSDREPEPRYRERLDAIMEDIRVFYRDGMEQAGFGPRTFDLARDAGGKLVIHLVKGKHPERDYQKRDAEKVLTDCRPVLKAAGLSFEHETVLVFCNLANWDPTKRVFSHHSPYYGMSVGGPADERRGLCFALDSEIQNLDDIAKHEPILNDDEYGDLSLGKFNTIFIGGVAHELGHAFALPHCGERQDEKSRGTSLLGVGNHTYREERRNAGRGSFLTMASAMRLASRPLFSHSDRGATVEPQLDTSEFELSTNVTRRELVGRPGALRVDGVVKGTPPVYGVVAYFDSQRDGGYHAPTATTVPDADGRFAIEISDLKTTVQGELRLEYCHANGAVSASRAPFRVTADGAVDLDLWESLKTLAPLLKAVSGDDRAAAQTQLGTIETSSAPALTKTVARKLAATLQEEPKPVPAKAPPALTELPLGDAQAKSSEVGWLKPVANRIPPNDQIESPLLDCGRIYATGLYAHAPSRYGFDLGGKWQTLRGEAGLHSAQQPYGSVVFVIRADGKEVFRSRTIRKTEKARYDIDLTNAKLLELIVEDGGNGNSNDWGLWLDPTLLRSPQADANGKP